MTFSLALDVLVAILLVVTIAYAVVLNRRLAALRRDRTKLEHLATSFGEATQRAGDSTIKLKQAAGALEACMEKAHKMREELKYLVDRGSGAADRLEQGIRATRGRPEPTTPTASVSSMMGVERRPKRPAPADGETTVPLAGAGHELLRALRAAR